MFSEVKLFQVKPTKIDEFENLVKEMISWQDNVLGCNHIKYVKRFYRIDKLGELPKALTRIVKCVKYYSYWEFDSIEHYSNAIQTYFEKFQKELSRLLIVPFDINLGENIEIN